MYRKIMARVTQRHTAKPLDLRSTGLNFDSWPPLFRVQPWASCSQTCLDHQAVLVWYQHELRR